MSKNHLPSNLTSVHSSAWITQVWISFIVSVGATAIGIWFLPVDIWMRAFMAMGLLFSVGSTLSLAKTVRDLHESDRLTAKVDEAKLHQILSQSEAV